MKIFTTTLFLWLVLAGLAQQGDGGTPISSKFAFEPELPQVSFSQPDLVVLAAEDTERDAKGMAPWRFGYVNNTSLNLSNSGAWFDLPNGGKLWMLEVLCENALTVNLTLQNSRIPEGNQLFVYHPNREFVLGKFVERHLIEGQLGLELIQGSRAIVEYYVAPENANNTGTIEIVSVTHGYRTAEDFNRGLGDSGSCNMNVNCPDGVPYQNLRNSAVMLVSGSNGFCSGALINNTANDGKPYVLTARHCGNSGFANWIFRFNWQAEACTNPGASPTFQSLSGSVNRAGSLNNTFDMRLVEITGGLESGTVPASYNPFFAGWDKSGNVPPSTICVHHPSGDIKKIAFDDDPAVAMQAMGSTVPNSTWRVIWDRNTTTEPGSSGSPLFDNMGRIIGQLWGGGASCTQLSSPDYYGRVSMSWNPEGSSNAQQLQHWLDPNNSEVSFINGFPEEETIALDASLSQGSNWELTGTVCGSTITPTLNITSFGAETVTSALINYTYTPGSTQQFNWTGSLTTGQSESINLPTQTLTDGNYSFSASITTVNGQTDENDNNNSTSSTFSIVDNGYQVQMNLQLDCFGEEITWRLLDQNQTQTLATGGPYTNAFSNPPLVTENWCLAEACYVLEINDSYGDGLIGGGFCQSVGSLQITESSAILNEITASQANFGNQKKLPFCLGEATNSIDAFGEEHFQLSLYPNPTSGDLNADFNVLGQKSIDVYSAQGVLIHQATTVETHWKFDTSALAQGMYFIQVQFAGNTQTVKFIKQ